jgi:hypothetical protein
MFRARIKLVYKQEIDEKTEGEFERSVFYTSYDEFVLRAGTYTAGGRFKTFSRMMQMDGRVKTLSQKIGFSTLPLLSELNNKIPLIKNNLGEAIDFETASLELVESHTEDISQHKVAVYYETTPLTLVEFMGEYLLLANGGKAENQLSDTFVVKMQPNLSIISYKGIAHPQIAWIASQQ